MYMRMSTHACIRRTELACYLSLLYTPYTYMIIQAQVSWKKHKLKQLMPALRILFQDVDTYLVRSRPLLLTSR